MLHQVEAVRHVTLRVPHPWTPLWFTFYKIYVSLPWEIIHKENKINISVERVILYRTTERRVHFFENITCTDVLNLRRNYLPLAQLPYNFKFYLMASWELLKKCYQFPIANKIRWRNEVWLMAFFIVINCFRTIYGISLDAKSSFFLM